MGLGVVVRHFCINDHAWLQYPKSQLNIRKFEPFEDDKMLFMDIAYELLPIGSIAYNKAFAISRETYDT